MGYIPIDTLGKDNVCGYLGNVGIGISLKINDISQALCFIWNKLVIGKEYPPIGTTVQYNITLNFRPPSLHFIEQ